MILYIISSRKQEIIWSAHRTWYLYDGARTQDAFRGENFTLHAYDVGARVTNNKEHATARIPMRCAVHLNPPLALPGRQMGILYVKSYKGIGVIYPLIPQRRYWLAELPRKRCITLHRSCTVAPLSSSYVAGTRLRPALSSLGTVLLHSNAAEIPAA